MSAAPDVPAACPNCFRPLPGIDGAPARFCPHCGQEARVRPPRLSEFVQQFGGAYFSTEGALWRTLKLLLLRPGELTRRYLSGQRKHFVLPLRLYLTISVMVLLALRTVAGIDVRINESGAPERLPDHLAIDLGFGRAGLEGGRFYCEQLPQWVCRRLQSRLDIDPGRLAQAVADYGERFVSHLGSAMFVLVPAFALWLKLVYLNRRLYYTEHLVFALHVHAFGFLMLGLMLPKVGPLAALAMLWAPVYAWLAMRRVYGGPWYGRLLRSAVVFLLYCATLGFAMALVAVAAILF